MPAVLPNAWLGVSAESQRWAQVRLPQLAVTPAVVRFASCEPLLGALDIRPWLDGGLDWVIAGGESGPGARPMHPDWARGLRDQCQATGVAFFFKLLCTTDAGSIQSASGRSGVTRRCSPRRGRRTRADSLCCGHECSKPAGTQQQAGQRGDQPQPQGQDRHRCSHHDRDVLTKPGRDQQRQRGQHPHDQHAARHEVCLVSEVQAEWCLRLGRPVRDADQRHKAEPPGPRRDSPGCRSGSGRPGVDPAGPPGAQAPGDRTARSTGRSTRRHGQLQPGVPPGAPAQRDPLHSPS
jgi:hypothetical protein